MPQPSAIAGQAARDLVRAWRHLLATDVVFRVVAFVVLAPLAGLLVRAIVATTGRSVVADKDLISFFLDPFGVVALIILAGVGLAIMGFEQAGLMAVGRGVLRGRPVNCIEALRFVVDRWRSILALTTRIASKALLIAAPFLAVSGAIFLWLLTERDIYFYVSTKPPELWLALGLIGPILALGALAVAWKAIGWLLAFPLMLFEGATPADALIAAGERIAGHRRVAAQLLAGWLVLSVVASSTALAIVNLAGGVASGFVGGSGLTLVIVGGAMLTLWGAMNFAATFVSSAVAALLLGGRSRRYLRRRRTRA